MGKKNAGDFNEYSTAKSILVSKMSGIEGLPYQFMSNVDQRISGTEIGRKYADKIISRLPLLFLTPCKPVFMDDFGDQDRRNMVDFLLSGSPDNSLLEGNGRYYSVEHDYKTYYKYLNVMLSSVAAFLGIYDEKININGHRGKIGEYSWQNELNDNFKTYFSAAENLIFYLDGMTQIQESYSNETTESSLASMINGFSDMANEIKFLFGEKGSSVIGTGVEIGKDITSSLATSLSGVASSLGGGIVGSLANNGVSTVLNGGKIVFPKVWSNSSRNTSYSIDIKLRSPDHDSLSIYLNVLKPYCKLLALVLPRIMEDDPNGYNSPFMTKAYCKGMFYVDYGMITGMNVTKGDSCCWNDDGLPTQIDISLDIEDLYGSHMAMSGFEGTFGNVKDIVSNTAYMDFLCNMAGLNLAQMEMGRKIKMYYYLKKTNLLQIPSRAFTSFDQTISKMMGKIYDLTS